MTPFSISDVITRCRLAHERMGAKNPHRDLIQECAVLIHLLATKVQALETETAEKPRIILPG